MKQTKQIKEPATAAGCCSNSLPGSCCASTAAPLLWAHQALQQQRQPRTRSLTAAAAAKTATPPAAAAVGVDSEGLPSAEAPAPNWCINSSSSNNNRTNSGSNSSSDSAQSLWRSRPPRQWSRRSPLPPPQQQGHQQSRDRGPLLGVSCSCQHQWANGLEPVELRTGVLPLLGGAPGTLTGGASFPYSRYLLTGMLSPFASLTDFCLWVTEVVKDALVAPKQQEHNLLLLVLPSAFAVIIHSRFCWWAAPGGAWICGVSAGGCTCTDSHRAEGHRPPAFLALGASSYTYP
ncbi:hypothetical protein Efla_007838 [Eimeria flavescens]